MEDFIALVAPVPIAYEPYLLYVKEKEWLIFNLNE